MPLDTPSSLGNDDRAAKLIQAAYRRHQERTETARRARTKAFEALEEADEAMINGRKGLMTKLQSKLSGGLAGKLSRGMQRSQIHLVFCSKLR